MSKNPFVTIDATAMHLGEKSTIELFQFALPIVIERQHSLEKHLCAGEWAAFKQFAHKSIGSVRLYGTERLEALLRQANDVDKDEFDLLTYQQELSEEFETVIGSIREWLALH